MSESYELYYWPMLQGRGEFVRLILEDSATQYVDVGRQADRGGIDAVRACKGEREGFPTFAPPVLKVDGLVLSQMPLICHFLGRRLGLAPSDELLLLRAAQLQLTIADLVDEVHDTHHPLGVTLYYEQQKEAALQRSRQFVSKRLPRFVDFFERMLSENGGEVLVGDAVSYVDLSLFQVLCGIEYAFPRAFSANAGRILKSLALQKRIAERPNIAAYLASPRRLPFNEDGIFRCYPELDSSE